MRWPRRPPWRARRRRGPGAAVLLAVTAGIALAAGASAVRGWAAEASPLRAPALAGRDVDVELRLDRRPARAGRRGRAPVVSDATVTALVARTAVPPGSTRAVLLFAPAEGWADLLPGQPVRARVSVAGPGPATTVVAVLSARGPPVRVGGPAPWERHAARRVRTGLVESSARVLDRAAAGLLPGLVVGDTSAADPVLEEDFRRAGLAHLTAVSGANVAIVVAAVLWPLRRRAVDAPGAGGRGAAGAAWPSSSSPGPVPASSARPRWGR